jgi:hypothetical protein
MKGVRASIRSAKQVRALIWRPIGALCLNGDAGHRFGTAFGETIAGYENEGVAK